MHAHRRAHTHTRMHAHTHTCTRTHAQPRPTAAAKSWALSQSAGFGGGAALSVSVVQSEDAPTCSCPPSRGGGHEGPWGLGRERSTWKLAPHINTFLLQQGNASVTVSAPPDGNLCTFMCSKWLPRDIEAGGPTLRTVKPGPKKNPPSDSTEN